MKKSCFSNKIHKTIYCFVLHAVALNIAFGGDQQGEVFAVVEAGKPKAAISLGEYATSVEEHAATELAKFVETATSVKLEIIRGGQRPESGNLFLLGTPGTHSEIKRALDEKQAVISAEKLGRDGYLIKTIRMGGKNGMVLGGLEPRCVLYAVYDFLERYLNAGFFWEGDRVPKTASLEIAAADIRERPYFSKRFYLQECIFSYSTRLWNLADWTKEMDWAAKKRQNMLMLPGERWNILVTREEIVREAKKRGFDFVLMGECERFDRVTASFMKTNPSHRYVQMRWCSDPPYHVLHPRDPLYVQRGMDIVRESIRKCGQNSIFFWSPYGEQRILGATPEEIREARIGMADSSAHILRQAAPAAKWTFWTWPFISSGWTKDDVMQFLAHVPKDLAFVCDSRSPSRPRDCHYKRFDYYAGRDWLLSFIHLYGGDDYLAGNLPQLIADIKEVTVDPKAKNCAGIYMCPEIIHCNTVYFDLLARLSWNPSRVDFDCYLRDYIAKRYGPGSFVVMRNVFECLKNAVYGPMPGMEAMYQHRISQSGFVGRYITGLSRQLAFAPAQAAWLRQALEKALSQAEAQRGNACYEKDMVDMMRQYLATLFNLHIRDLQAAFQKKDRESAGAEMEFLRHLMDGVETVLSTYPPYQLHCMLENAAQGTDEQRRRAESDAKDPMLTFVSKEWLVDYPSKDVYELVKYYYRPRIEAYLKMLDDSLANKTPVNEKRLLESYRQIEKKWRDQPLGEMEAGRDGDAVKTIARVFAGVNQTPGMVENWKVIPVDEIMDNREPLWKTVAWNDRFQDLDRWCVTHYEGGRFVLDDNVATLFPSKKGHVVYGTALKVSMRQHPWLCFRFRQLGESPEGSVAFTLWATWRDASGCKWRSRIYQGEPVLYNQWTVVTLNLLKILGILSHPVSLEKLEIEVAGETTQWDFIKAGCK
ncbi:MAG: alpha-N-acetylglucosaminidase TIM-barrel domain-containing protein [Verrucomicrobiae bacterium]|nr:alpha-N-acetylglucosaminidase TIM-barrel domain-containing protein [Verrucomicrobiae bacterium]